MLFLGTRPSILKCCPNVRWVRAKTPKLMAGSGLLLIINNLQADQAELLNPRIQAVRGKQNNSGPGSPLPSNVNSPIEQHVVVFCNFSVLCFH